MFDFSPVQIVLVLAIALLIFGPKRLPEMGRSLGRGIRDFKDQLTGDARAERIEVPTTSTPDLSAIAAEAEAERAAASERRAEHDRAVV